MQSFPFLTAAVSDVYRDIYRRSTSRHKKLFLLLLAGLLASTIIETGAVALIAMYASAIASPSSLQGILAKLPARLQFLASPDSSKDFLLIFSAVVLVCAAVKNLARCASQYGLNLYCADISTHFGKLFLRGFKSMPFEWHMRQKSSDILTAFQWRDVIGGAILVSVIQVVNECALLVLLSSTILFINPGIFLLIIAIGTLGAGVIFFLVRPALDSLAKSLLKTYGDIYDNYLHLVNGIKDVIIFNAKSRLTKIDAVLDDYAGLVGKQAFVLRLPSDILEVVGIALITGTVIFLVVYQNQSIAVVMGTLALITVTAWRVLPSINQILSCISRIRSTLPSARRHLEYLRQFDAQVNQIERPLPDALPLKREIRLESVSYAYDDAPAPALQHVSFTLKKGSTLGLVGASGAGKSTLADLVMGLLTPTEGAIFIDDVRLSADTALAWRKTIGYVPQSSYIENDTLRSNIAFGKLEDEIDDARVRESCRKSNILDFLEGLPEGLDTVMGERGVRLSGGQGQRLAIARALYVQPGLIVLDEATSALDHKNEKIIQETLQRLHGSVTMIIIAHRMSTLDFCDDLLWLENGKVRLYGDAKDVLEEYAKSL
jgi:ABC-type multidrug transport system fused ATPase/permease subunit